MDKNKIFIQKYKSILVMDDIKKLHYCRMKEWGKKTDHMKMWSMLVLKKLYTDKDILQFGAPQLINQILTGFAIPLQSL